MARRIDGGALSTQLMAPLEGRAIETRHEPCNRRKIRTHQTTSRTNDCGRFDHSSMMRWVVPRLCREALCNAQAVVTGLAFAKVTGSW
jgi:hypothetical protein